MAAAFYRLDNLISFVDRNFVQIDGPTEKVMALEPLADKWQAFGWNVILCNGHDHSDVISAAERAKQTSGRPTVIIAHTIMSKGVKSIEGDYLWHGKPPAKDQVAGFLQELYEG